MTNDELIEIAAKAHAQYDNLRWRIEAEDSDDELPPGGVFGAIIAALRAAGAIPTEGAVTIDRGRWERVLALAQAAVRLDGATAMKVVETEDQYVLYGMARNSEECRIALWSAVIGMGGIRPGDLDAVLDPTEPLQAPTQTP